MRKALLGLFFIATVAVAQIQTPLTNPVLKTDMDASSHRITGLDVTNLPLQPLDSNLTAISANGVTAVGLGVLSQPDLTSLRSYVGATGTVVNTSAPVTNNFLTGFDSGTGNFSRAPVAYSGITGAPTPPATISPTPNQWITGFDATTGTFTQSQPAFTNISGTAANSQIPATLSGKTIDDTNSISVKDGSFFIENTATPTKKLTFDLSAITAGNTRTVAVPNTNSTLVVPAASVSHQFVTSVGPSGSVTQSQPDFTDLTGVATSSQLPTLNNILAPTASLNLNGQQITNVGAPTTSSAVATKGYTDTAVAAGVPPPHQAVAAATTANVTLSGEQTIDGIATSASRVLVKNQTTGSENGIYVTGAGAWTRATDADTGSEIPGLIFVSAGTANGFTGWAATNPLPITVGTTALTYTQTSSVPTYTAGSGLAIDGTQFSVKGTPSRILVGAGGVDIDSGYVGQSSINTLGTVTTGTWQGSLISGAYGGTGVNNTGKTITLGGNLITTGVTTLSGANTGDVSLTGQGYLSLSGQQITVNPIDLSGTNATGTLAAARMPALTGDVTSSAGSTATTIANNSVTNSKLGQAAANTIKGNNTGSTANVVDMTIPQFKTLASLSNVENTALSTWAGSPNLNTVGTITTGTWSGTAVAIAKGGTGASTASGARANILPLTGNAGKTLVVNGTGTDLTPVSQYAKTNVVTFTSGSGTYTPSSGTIAITVEAVGGGGGGAGAQSNSSETSVGSGGAGAAYVKHFMTVGSPNYSYAVGAGGTGGAGANGAGGAGGDTTFGGVVTAAHGNGGTNTAGSGTTIAKTGQGGRCQSTSVGNIIMIGGDGNHGFRLSNTVGEPGFGGSSVYCGNAQGANGPNSNGNDARAYGGGGSGAWSSNTAAFTGGAGAGGVIIITEYIQTTAP